MTTAKNTVTVRAVDTAHLEPGSCFGQAWRNGKLVYETLGKTGPNCWERARDAAWSGYTARRRACAPELARRAGATVERRLAEVG